VNDAPAVQAADIGIAMGITGTDVTKEASDMVLTDDNFASIVAAVEEGRAIFDNIRKVLLFLLSCNLGEILLLLGASLLGWEAPLVPIQLLWINLVTDGLPALALTLEPPEPGNMRRRPRPSREAIINGRTAWSILFQGLVDASVALSAFAICYLNDPTDLDRAQGVTFCVVVYSELFRALSARSQSLTLLQVGLRSNPMLILACLASGLLQLAVLLIPATRDLFQVQLAIDREWWLIALLSLTPVTLVEIFKIAKARWWPEPSDAVSEIQSTR